MWQQFVRGIRCTNVVAKNYSTNTSVQHLLDNAITFLDRTPAQEHDLWSTPTYPECSIVPERSRQPTHEKTEPEDTTVIVFSGYGTNYVDYTKSLLTCPEAISIFERASAVLKYDVLKMCLSPKQMLRLPAYNQPAIFTTSMAHLIKLQDDRPNVIESCMGAVGYDVGEIAALTFAGALQFEQALRLVQIRGEAMQMAINQRNDTGAVTIKISAATNLKIAIQKAKEYCIRVKKIKDPECSVAVCFDAWYRTITGHADALIFLQENMKKFAIRHFQPIKYPHSLNSNLMASAVKPISRALSIIDLRDPTIVVYSNFDGKQYRRAKEIFKKLPKQIISQIKWDQCLRSMYARPKDVGIPRTFYIGPDQTKMEALVLSCNRRAWLASERKKSNNRRL